MPKVSIHPPKTPVTKGSSGVAKNTLPNVCKMPGPPAPFVPSPLPNIARSGTSPKDYSKTVKIEGHTVAIRGASFGSMGDVASKATGGGLLSANTHGPAKFITPGSLTVKAEGKAIHLLGEPMLNNCGASGSPPNTGATMGGVDQGKGKKETKCPHDTLETKERSHTEAIAEKQQQLDEARKAEAEAQSAMTATSAAVKNPPKGERMSTLRQLEKQAMQRHEDAMADTRAKEKAVAGAEREKKVADDCGGGKTYQIICTACGDIVGDFDVVTDDGRVKEVKSSKGGAEKAKFDKYRDLVEARQILGPGKKMKIAVPPGVGAAVEAENPALAGRVQEH